jgi:acyl-coenzyme A synthetase/AMP-(fatty) acid ligase
VHEIWVGHQEDTVGARDRYSTCSDVVGSAYTAARPRSWSCAPDSPEDQLRAHARKFLADHKVPERTFLAELPKGLTRKIGRRSLRDILIAQPDAL